MSYTDFYTVRSNRPQPQRNPIRFWGKIEDGKAVIAFTGFCPERRKRINIVRIPPEQLEPTQSWSRYQKACIGELPEQARLLFEEPEGYQHLARIYELWLQEQAKRAAEILPSV